MQAYQHQQPAGYYAPSQANVIAGTYTPFRWLWEVTPNTIPTTGPNLAEGVWIAYMKLDAGITLQLQRLTATLTSSQTTTTW